MALALGRNEESGLRRLTRERVRARPRKPVSHRAAAVVAGARKVHGWYPANENTIVSMVFEIVLCPTPHTHDTRRPHSAPNTHQPRHTKPGGAHSLACQYTTLPPCRRRMPPHHRAALPAGAQAHVAQAPYPRCVPPPRIPGPHPPRSAFALAGHGVVHGGRAWG
eukprot:scaffold65802_cov40-Phaeocystis_antarctica.AAC.1